MTEFLAHRSLRLIEKVVQNNFCAQTTHKKLEETLAVTLCILEF